MGLAKLKLSSRLVRLAYTLVDVEASGTAAAPSPRIVEYAFVIQKLASLTPGRVLDVGCAARVNYLPAALASLGWQVTGIDIRPFEFEYPTSPLSAVI
jgi:2-polyprenyl-3-methyl-5-hydroxy-6-metoxy-1,4-benzoquinol methylase